MEVIIKISFHAAHEVPRWLEFLHHLASLHGLTALSSVILPKASLGGSEKHESLWGSPCFTAGAWQRVNP